MDVEMPSIPEMKVAQGLQLVRGKFIESLCDRILLFEAAMAAYSQTGDYEKALKEISKEAHKITGVAGSVGFPDISDQARQIEQIIGSGVKAPDPHLMRCVAPVLETFLDNLEIILDLS